MTKAKPGSWEGFNNTRASVHGSDYLSLSLKDPTAIYSDNCALRKKKYPKSSRFLGTGSKFTLIPGDPKLHHALLGSFGSQVINEVLAGFDSR